MLIHFSLLGYICVLGLLFHKADYNDSFRKKLIIFLSFFPIFLIESLRKYTVGIDSPSYTRSYEIINMTNNSWEERTWEKGFVVLNKLIWLLSKGNVQFLFAVVSAIILIGIGIFIYNNSEDISVFWPIFIFVTFNFYLTSMVSLRQFCALAIVLNVYTVLKKDKTKKGVIISILLILLAMQFHTSSVISVIWLVILRMKTVNRKRIVFAGGIMIVALVSIDAIMGIIRRISPYYGRLLQQHSSTSLGGVYSMLALIVLVLTVCIFCLNPEKHSNYEIYVLLLLVIFGVGIEIWTTRYVYLFRLAYYFEVYLTLLIPKFISKLQGESSKILVSGLFLAFGFSYFAYKLYSNDAMCVPYLFFWQ